MNCAKTGPEAKILIWKDPRGPLGPAAKVRTRLHWMISTLMPPSTTARWISVPGASTYRSSQSGNRPKFNPPTGSGPLAKTANCASVTLPLVEAKRLALVTRGLVTALVNGAELSSPLVIAVPVALMSVNVPGRLLTIVNWARAVAETARPAAPARANALRWRVMLMLRVVCRLSWADSGRVSSGAETSSPSPTRGAVQHTTDPARATRKRKRAHPVKGAPARLGALRRALRGRAPRGERRLEAHEVIHVELLIARAVRRRVGRGEVG